MLALRLPAVKRLAAAAVFLAFLHAARPAAAQQPPPGNALPLPRLTTVTPCGGKVGGSFEVAFAGTDLDEPQGLLFSHPGLRAEPLLPSPPPPDPKKPMPPPG